MVSRVERFARNLFLVGPGPIRRTLPYLNAGRLIFRENVRIMEVHYNMYWKLNEIDPLKKAVRTTDIHTGLRDFYFWNVPQIQYKNPNVQIVRFCEMTPNPFIRCWLDDGRDILFDCDSKNNEEIIEQLSLVLGKSKERIEFERNIIKEKSSSTNPAIFGYNQPRFCICEIPGQVPCSGTCDLPKNMKGKFVYYLREELEAWEQDLDPKYPTEEEKHKKMFAFPLPIKPIKMIDNLDKIEIGKPDQGRNLPLNPDYKRFIDRQKKDEDLDDF